MPGVSNPWAVNHYWATAHWELGCQSSRQAHEALFVHARDLGFAHPSEVPATGPWNQYPPHFLVFCMLVLLITSSICPALADLPKTKPDLGASAACLVA